MAQLSSNQLADNKEAKDLKEIFKTNIKDVTTKENIQ
jgi:hypothetical protein